jgi:hypothetical protein
MKIYRTHTSRKAWRLCCLTYSGNLHKTNEWFSNVFSTNWTTSCSIWTSSNFPCLPLNSFDFDIKIPWFHNKNLWFWQNLAYFERRLINLGSSNSCIVPYSIWIILWSLDVKVRDMSLVFFLKKKTLQNSL